LAALCVLLGLIPLTVIDAIDYVTVSLIGEKLAPVASESGWLLLTPLSPVRASYSPIIFLLVTVLVTVGSYLLVRRYFRRGTRRADAWNCGYPLQTPRMQDTAEGFGQPISQIFEPAFEIERTLPDPTDLHPVYRKRQADRSWRALYLPVARVVEVLSDLVGRMQHGRIQWYLFYSFATLLILLAFVR
jgi:hypothetical protein